MVFRAGWRGSRTRDVARFSKSVKIEVEQRPKCMDHAILHRKPFSIIVL